MTDPMRLVGGLLGAVAGVLLTILPCLWDGYQSTHRTDPDIVRVWIRRSAPAAAVPLLVGAFVGQSLPARIGRKEAPRS